MDDDLEASLHVRRVAVAESCTGGLVAQALAQIPGSGDWFRGGVVAYHRDVKYQVLDVSRGPVVTARAACEMARGAARLLDADVTVAVTGAAGPDPQDGASPGTVFIACAVDGHVDVREYAFDGDPPAVCAAARDQALVDLRSALRDAARL